MSVVLKEKRIRYKHFDVTYYNIIVPDYYDCFKTILILADIHDQFQEELLEYVKTADIDAIFIPGDLCNEHIVSGGHVYVGKKQYGISAKGLEFVRMCAEKSNTFYSRGNHEWI